MSQTSLSVWFVCRLCRGSFGQVDAFIEHKKQKHFTQFQNTTSIVFEESELGELCPTIVKAENQLVDESPEPTIKIEGSDDEPVIPFCSEIIHEPNVDLVQPKSELITFECEINPDNENSFFGLKQPEQNPYVLLKRLTSEEIQSAYCVLHQQSALLKCEQKNLENNSESRYSLDSDDSNIIDSSECDKSTEDRPTTNVEHDSNFECKLCSKQFQSDGQLKIHVGICALYHEDRKRFCVICNRKLYNTQILKDHRLRFHGTEEEKLSLHKFKCDLCPKKYRHAIGLAFHIESHQKNKQDVEPSESKFPKCSQPNCGKEFPDNSKLQRHISTVHLGVKPFSCHFPNCNKAFSQRVHLNVHLRIHTGERPFKCTVANCNKAFISCNVRSKHLCTVHRNLLNE